jgi:hypothetical protein
VSEPGADVTADEFAGVDASITDNGDGAGTDNLEVEADA